MHEEANTARKMENYRRGRIDLGMTQLGGVIGSCHRAKDCKQ
jgi:hypothetical protein